MKQVWVRKMHRRMLWSLMLTLALSVAWVVQAQTDVAAAPRDQGITLKLDVPSGLYGYVDDSGKWLIAPRFEYAREFHEGLAAVAEPSGRWGYIRPDGSYAIQPEYRAAYDFRGGLAVVDIGKKAGVIDTTGALKLKSSYYLAGAGDVDGYLAVITDVDPSQVLENRRYGLITNRGVEIKPAYDGRPDVFDGFITLYKEGASGEYMDRTTYVALDDGKVIQLPGELRSVSDGVGLIAYYVDPSESLNRSNPRTRYAYLLPDGKIIDAYTDWSGRKHVFVEACNFSEGLACVAINRTEMGHKHHDDWGYLKKDGTWLIQPNFERAGDFNDGIAPVKAGYSWGYLNFDGSWFIEPVWVESASNVPEEFGFDTGAYKQSEVDYVYREARAIVKSLVNDSMSDYDKLRVIYQYITEKVKYDQNFYAHNVPRISYTAYGALRYNIAVCEGYSELLNVMLNMAGVENRIITGTIGSSGIAHAWNLIRIDGALYHVDATWDAGMTKWDYFLRSDDYMKLSRTWNEQKYEAAPKDYK